jgi:hypothetical protein
VNHNYNCQVIRGFLKDMGLQPVSWRVFDSCLILSLGYFFRSRNGILCSLYINIEVNCDNLDNNLQIFFPEFFQFDEMAITHFIRLPSD